MREVREAHNKDAEEIALMKNRLKEEEVCVRAGMRASLVWLPWSTYTRRKPTMVVRTRRRQASTCSLCIAPLALTMSRVSAWRTASHTVAACQFFCG